MAGQGRAAGFTLIELSIVLVIIGLIVGGILVGQDLIKAAETRAQISQIEKYNSAVNTFRAKFNALPGDMAVATANQFGFGVSLCDGARGRRDGNGLIDGHITFPLDQAVGETGFFWADISSDIAGDLIDGTFPNSGGVALSCGGASPALNTTPGATYIGAYLPAAKIGHGNFVYVYETNGFNWFGISAVTSITVGAVTFSSTSIPVIQAYNMDKKVDDGLPLTGAVQTAYINNNITSVVFPPNAATDNNTTCYNTTSNTYSIGSLANYGAGGNCALSFRFQ